MHRFIGKRGREGRGRQRDKGLFRFRAMGMDKGESYKLQRAARDKDASDHSQ